MTKPLISRLVSSTVLAAALVGGAALPSMAATARPVAAAHHTAAKPAAKATPKKAKAKKAKKKVVKKVAVANLTSFESALLKDINNARKQHGLNTLTAAPGYTDVARRWTLQLAEDAALSHNPDVVNDLQSSGGGNWTWIGENVGDGPATDESGLFAAYMASPHHRDNILDVNAKYIGVGAIAIDDGQGDQTVYNTCDFVDSYSSSYGADKTKALGNVVTLDQAQAAF